VGGPLQLWSQIYPLYPAGNFPLGSDLRFIANGSADLWISHDANVAAKTIVSGNLSIGVNSNVVVGSTAGFTASSAIAPIWIGRETANEEFGATYTVVDTIHMNITCTKSHTGPVDIEQLGATSFDGGFPIVFKPANPSQLSGRSASMRFEDANGNYTFTLPGNTGDSFPFSAFRFATKLTGVSNSIPPGTADLIIQNADSSHCTVILASTNSGRARICDTTMQFGGSMLPYPYQFKLATNAHLLLRPGTDIGTTGVILQADNDADNAVQPLVLFGSPVTLAGSVQFLVDATYEIGATNRPINIYAAGVIMAPTLALNSNLTWTSGAGVPSSGTCTSGTIGSLYSNTSGGATTTLYVCTSAGTWTAK
jgi:hypothetical protein